MRGEVNKSRHFFKFMISKCYQNHLGIFLAFCLKILHTDEIGLKSKLFT